MIKKVNAIDTTTLAEKTDYNAKIKYIENKILSITNLVTTAALTVVENKMPNVNALVKKAELKAEQDKTVKRPIQFISVVKLILKMMQL